MFAQVALAREAMREGEVADEAAVTDAVARLRSEVGLKKAVVRVGIASPRVVVRQVEMPVMTREELSSALQYQAGDLIPIPVDEAVIDFAILGNSIPNGDGAHEPTMQVLLAAAYESTVLKLVQAVEAGGFQVGAVDLVPLALVRALTHPAALPVAASVPAAAGGVALAEEPPGAEGIVSLGGGVTSIAVHENGIPQFVRVIGSGGRELTDAIATDLEVPIETAEALKRALGHPQPDEMINRARTAVDRPLSTLLDEVRSSIDYYRNQPGAARLQKVVVTGGTAQLPGMPERLSALLGVHVEPAYMHDLLGIGDIGFPPEELPRLEPYLPAPVGLALGGANVGTVVDLTPRRRRSASSKMRRNFDQRIVAGAMAGVVLLAAATWYEKKQASDAKHKADSAVAVNEKLANEANNRQNAGIGGKKATPLQLKSAAATILDQDIQWGQVVDEIGNNDLPPGVLFTSASGTRTAVAKPAATTTTPTTTASTSGSSTSSSSTGTATPAAGAAAAPGLSALSLRCISVPLNAGTLTFQGTAPNVPAIAQTLDNMNGDKNLAGALLMSASATTVGKTVLFNFTITAALANAARGNRLEEYKLCK
jgi:type IV pilus assembly protein PilM